MADFSPLPVSVSRALPTPSFLTGGGKAGDLMRAHGWQATPLGEPNTWENALKTLVDVMLAANQPMFVAWGPERTLLYNDAYAPMLGDRHPSAMGLPFFAVWAEVVDEISPLFERVFAGEPINMDDIELYLERPGRTPEAHFAFSYVPVRGDTGMVEGLFCICRETTEQVSAVRSQAQVAS